MLVICGEDSNTADGDTAVPGLDRPNGPAPGTSPASAIGSPVANFSSLVPRNLLTVFAAPRATVLAPSLMVGAAANRARPPTSPAALNSPDMRALASPPSGS